MERKFKKRLKIITMCLFCLISYIASAQKSFEFVVIPDSQTLVEEFPEVYKAQMEWIANNKKRFSFALHVGDITQNNSEEEWEVAKSGLFLLNKKVPYNLSLGNHDMGSKSGKFADTRNTTLANTFFPVSEYINNSKAIETFPKGTIDNTCSEYQLAGKRWLVFSLEFGPRNKTLVWVENLIKSHPHHKIIINTHAYMYEDNTLHDGDDYWQPQAYGVGKDIGSEAVNNGCDIWTKLVKKYKNIMFVFSGHVLKSGVGTLVSTGDKGNKVYQMLANYQKHVKGEGKADSGYLRIIKVDKKHKTISVKTYSPWLNKFRTELEHEFVFENVKI